HAWHAGPAQIRWQFTPAAAIRTSTPTFAGTHSVSGILPAWTHSASVRGVGVRAAEVRLWIPPRLGHRRHQTVPDPHPPPQTRPRTKRLALHLGFAWPRRAGYSESARPPFHPRGL